MFEVVVIIAVMLAIAIACVLLLARPSQTRCGCSARSRIKAPPEWIFSLIITIFISGGLVALRTEGSGDEAHLWRGGARRRARSMPGRATGMSVPAAWKFSKPPRRKRSSSSSISSRRSEGHNTAEFTMLPQGDGTHVTWVMHGPRNFMTKLIQVFMNLDNMIGKDFEAGLANLKTLTEK